MSTDSVWINTYVSQLQVTLLSLILPICSSLHHVSGPLRNVSGSDYSQKYVSHFTNETRIIKLRLVIAKSLFLLRNV